MIEYIISVHEITIIDGDIQVTYIFTYLLDLLITERGQLTSPSRRFVYSFLQFYQVLPSFFDVLLLGTYTLRIVNSCWRHDSFVIT